MILDELVGVADKAGRLTARSAVARFTETSLAVDALVVRADALVRAASLRRSSTGRPGRAPSTSDSRRTRGPRSAGEGRT